MKTLQLPAEVRDVAQALIAALGDDLRALLWHGSFARGEAGADSDHDLVVILKRVDDDLLLRMRDVFRGRANWSTFVQSEEELSQYPPDGRFQFHFGFVTLHGDFRPPPWTRENMLADLRALAREIRAQCRYRLVHNQPDDPPGESPRADFERHRNLRMLHHAAKWALLALKSREVLHGRDYPLTRAELRERLSDRDELALVDLVERWPELSAEYAEDTSPLALQLDAFARRLVSQLPEEAD